MEYSLVNNKKSRLLTIVNQLILADYMGLILIILRRHCGITEYGYVFVIRFLLYVALFILCMIKIFHHFSNHWMYSVFRLILLAYSGFVLFSKLEFSFFNYFLYGENFFALIMMIIAVKDIPFDTIVKAYIIPSIGFVAIRLLGTITNWLPWEYRLLDDDITQAVNFGCGNHNVFPNICMFICFAWIYIYRKRKNIYIDVIVIIAYTLTIFYFARSKTSAALALGYCVIITLLWLYNKYLKTEKAQSVLKAFSFISIFAPVISLLSTIGGLAYFNYQRTHVDPMFHPSTFFSRFYTLSMDCSNNNIWTPFYFQPLNSETSFNWLAGGEFTTGYNDNLFHSMFIGYGIIILLLVFALMQCCACKAYKCSNYTLCIILSLLSVLSLMENSIISISSNVFALIAFATLDSETIPDYTLELGKVISSKYNIKEKLCQFKKTCKVKYTITLSICILYITFTIFMLIHMALYHITAVTYGWMAATSYIVFYIIKDNSISKTTD